MTVRTAIPIIQLLTTVGTTITIAIAGWLLSNFASLQTHIHTLDNRVTAIEQQQFTIKDSITLNEKILDKIAILDARITAVLSKPPEWLEQFLKSQQ